MAEGPSLCEQGNLTTAMTALADEAGAAAAMRIRRMDQLAADSASMWAANLTTPSVMSAHGMRIAAESGAGRTRAETNNPPNTAAPGSSG